MNTFDAQNTAKTLFCVNKKNERNKNEERKKEKQVKLKKDRDWG